MSYAPDTLPRGYDWRDDAECRSHDPEMWHPGGTTGPWIPQIEDAKAVCRACPVMAQCQQWALDHGQESGIWGGMTEQERANWRRRMAREKAAAAKPLPTLRPNLTLAEVYAQLTTEVDDHIDWLGGGATTVGGSCYSPNRLAWAVTRGTPPVGSVVRYCDRPQCVAHIEDRAEREARKATVQPKVPESGCGTRPGYQAHRKRGEDACGPCRQANADADRRLRNTGTTKQEPKPVVEEPRPLSAGVARCGTTDGYSAHKRWQEPACQACQNAHDADIEQRQAAARAAAAVPSLPTCGSRSGYDVHTARGEAPCMPCTDARERTDWLLRTGVTTAA